jgi:pimeloyl-ACP methyl ester carboxylesterase
MQRGYSELPVAGFISRRVNVAGAQIACWERAGKGPCLVLVHGNSASKAAFADLLRHAGLTGRRMIAFDLPGSGESSDARDDQYTIPAFARTLIGFVRQLELVQPVVVGWSLGGHVALEAVGQDASAFSAVVLTGTPPFGPGSAEFAETFHRNGDLMQVAVGESPPSELLDLYVQALYGKSRLIPPELFAAARRCHGRMRRVLVEHWMSGIEGVAQRRVIAEWPGPIAAIQGEDEPFFDPRLLDTLTWRNLWRGRSQLISGAGHAPFFEKPDVYARLLAEFLQSLGYEPRSESP